MRPRSVRSPLAASTNNNNNNNMASSRSARRPGSNRGAAPTTSATSPALASSTNGGAAAAAAPTAAAATALPSLPALSSRPGGGSAGGAPGSAGSASGGAAAAASTTGGFASMTTGRGGGGAPNMISRRSMSPNVRALMSGSVGNRSRSGPTDRATAERRVKITQKRMRDLLRQEAKERQNADQERDEFGTQVLKDFDTERESMITKTIVRLNNEVLFLKHQLNSTESVWRGRWRRVIGELGRFNDMLHAEGIVPENVVANLLAAPEVGESGKNFQQIGDSVAAFTKVGNEKIQGLKREKLDEQLRGDELKMKLENRVRELDAADRLIRTHLVGRGSEATIAVELFRKQGIEFEKRFKNLEREFTCRVDQLLKDSASIEMVGSRNYEDAILAKLKQNRELDGAAAAAAAAAVVACSPSGATTAAAPGASTLQQLQQQQQLKLTVTEENARKVETSRQWRPSGNNYVDVIESFITSTECQKILQVQLLRDVQLAMIELAKRHFDNVTSEVRKNRSNLPSSVRNKLFNEKVTTRDDLIEMLDLLSFEAHNAEMIMGRFPPTELDVAAPQLQRFIDSHGVPNRSAGSANNSNIGNTVMSLAQYGLGSPGGNNKGAYASGSLSPGESVSNAPIDGGDSRSAGVDLSQGSKTRAQKGRPTLPNTNSGVPSRIGFPVAFGAPAAPTSVTAKRVTLPRQPFDGYTERVQANHALAVQRAKDAESSGFGLGVDAGDDDGASSLGDHESTA